MKTILNQVTRVKFLINESDPDNVDLFAYMPYEGWDARGVTKSCYSACGQHSACSPEYAAKSREATEAEYLPLKKELESLGYNLKVLNK